MSVVHEFMNGEVTAMGLETFVACVGSALFVAGAGPLASRYVDAYAGSANLAVVRSETKVHQSRSLWWIVGAACVAAAVIRWRWGGNPGFALTLTAATPVLLALTVIDLRFHRLPNRLNAVLGVICAGGLTLSALSTHDGAALRRACLGALALGAMYFALALLGGGAGMGLGDVKLAPSLGALAGWISLDAWALAAISAFMFGGFWGLALMCRGRSRKTRIAFGPFMVVGFAVAVAVS